MIVRRVISYVLICCFITTNTAWSIPQTAWDRRIPTDQVNPQSISPAIAQKDTSRDLAALVIPEAYGWVHEISPARTAEKRDRWILQIQDIHANYEAQRSIRDILEFIDRPNSHCRADLIALEGAQGNVDVGLLRGAPDEKAKLAVTEKFLKAAYFTGAEAYAINSVTAPPRVLGVENKDLYFENLDAFRKAYRASEEAKAPMQAMRKDLETRAHGTFSGPALEFFNQSDAFAIDKESLTEYAQYLKRMSSGLGIDVQKYTHLARVWKFAELEAQIDAKKLEAERKALLEVLQRRLVQEELAVLIQKSLYYRTGKMSRLDFYRYLAALAKDKKISWDSYTNLAAYVRTVELYADFKMDELLEEIDRFEDQAKQALYTNPEQSELDRRMNDWRMLQSLLELKFNRKKLAYYQKHREEIQPAASYAIDTRAAEQFYELAVRRDSVLVANAVAAFTDPKVRTIAMVTGGFHSEGVRKLIKEQGYSYAMITPRADDKTDDQLYASIMLDEQHAFSKLLDQQGNRLAAIVHSLNGLMNPAQAEENKGLQLTGLAGQMLWQAVSEGADSAKLKMIQETWQKSACGAGASLVLQPNQKGDLVEATLKCPDASKPDGNSKTIVIFRNKSGDLIMGVKNAATLIAAHKDGKQTDGQLIQAAAQSGISKEEKEKLVAYLDQQSAIVANLGDLETYMKLSSRPHFVMGDANFGGKLRDENRREIPLAWADKSFGDKRLLTVDHHYPDKPELRRKTATILMIEHLQAVAKGPKGQERIDALTKAPFLTTPNLDPDSMLAQYVLKHWDELKDEQDILDLLKAVTFYSDFTFRVKKDWDADFLEKVKALTETLYGLQSVLMGNNPSLRGSKSRSPGIRRDPESIRGNLGDAETDEIIKVMLRVISEPNGAQNLLSVPRFKTLHDFDEKYRKDAEAKLEKLLKGEPPGTPPRIQIDKKFGIVTVDLGADAMIYAPTIIQYLRSARCLEKNPEFARARLLITRRGPPTGQAQYVLTYFPTENEDPENPTTLPEDIGHLIDSLNALEREKLTEQGLVQDLNEVWGGRGDFGGGPRKLGSQLALDAVAAATAEFLKKPSAVPPRVPAPAITPPPIAPPRVAPPVPPMFSTAVPEEALAAAKLPGESWSLKDVLKVLALPRYILRTEKGRLKEGRLPDEIRNLLSCFSDIKMPDGLPFTVEVVKTEDSVFVNEKGVPAHVLFRTDGQGNIVGILLPAKALLDKNAWEDLAIALRHELVEMQLREQFTGVAREMGMDINTKKVQTWIGEASHNIAGLLEDKAPVRQFNGQFLSRRMFKAILAKGRDQYRQDLLSGRKAFQERIASNPLLKDLTANQMMRIKGIAIAAGVPNDLVPAGNIISLLQGRADLLSEIVELHFPGDENINAGQSIVEGWLQKGWITKEILEVWKQSMHAEQAWEVFLGALSGMDFLNEYLKDMEEGGPPALFRDSKHREAFVNLILRTRLDKHARESLQAATSPFGIKFKISRRALRQFRMNPGAALFALAVPPPGPAGSALSADTILQMWDREAALLDGWRSLFSDVQRMAKEEAAAREAERERNRPKGMIDFSKYTYEFSKVKSLKFNNPLANLGTSSKWVQELASESARRYFLAFFESMPPEVLGELVEDEMDSIKSIMVALASLRNPENVFLLLNTLFPSDQRVLMVEQSLADLSPILRALDALAAHKKDDMQYALERLQSLDAKRATALLIALDPGVNKVDYRVLAGQLGIESPVEANPLSLQKMVFPRLYGMNEPAQDILTILKQVDPDLVVTYLNLIKQEGSRQIALHPMFLRLINNSTPGNIRRLDPGVFTDSTSRVFAQFLNEILSVESDLSSRDILLLTSKIFPVLEKMRLDIGVDAAEKFPEFLLSLMQDQERKRAFHTLNSQEALKNLSRYLGKGMPPDFTECFAAAAEVYTNLGLRTETMRSFAGLRYDVMVLLLQTLRHNNTLREFILFTDEGQRVLAAIRDAGSAGKELIELLEKPETRALMSNTVLMDALRRVGRTGNKQLLERIVAGLKGSEELRQLLTDEDSPLYQIVFQNAPAAEYFAEILEGLQAKKDPDQKASYLRMLAMPEFLRLPRHDIPTFLDSYPRYPAATLLALSSSQDRQDNMNNYFIEKIHECLQMESKKGPGAQGATQMGLKLELRGNALVAFVRDYDSLAPKANDSLKMPAARAPPVPEEVSISLRAYREKLQRSSGVSASHDKKMQSVFAFMDFAKKHGVGVAITSGIARNLLNNLIHGTNLGINDFDVRLLDLKIGESDLAALGAAVSPDVAENLRLLAARGALIAPALESNYASKSIEIFRFFTPEEMRDKRLHAIAASAFGEAFGIPAGRSVDQLTDVEKERFTQAEQCLLRITADKIAILSQQADVMGLLAGGAFDVVGDGAARNTSDFNFNDVEIYLDDQSIPVIQDSQGGVAALQQRKGRIAEGPRNTHKSFGEQAVTEILRRIRFKLELGMELDSEDEQLMDLNLRSLREFAARQPDSHYPGLSKVGRNRIEKALKKIFNIAEDRNIPSAKVQAALKPYLPILAAMGFGDAVKKGKFSSYENFMSAIYQLLPAQERERMLAQENAGDISSFDSEEYTFHGTPFGAAEEAAHEGSTPLSVVQIFSDGILIPGSNNAYNHDYVGKVGVKEHAAGVYTSNRVGVPLQYAKKANRSGAVFIFPKKELERMIAAHEAMKNEFLRAHRALAAASDKTEFLQVLNDQIHALRNLAVAKGYNDELDELWWQLEWLARQDDPVSAYGQRKILLNTADSLQHHHEGRHSYTIVGPGLSVRRVAKVLVTADVYEVLRTEYLRALGEIDAKYTDRKEAEVEKTRYKDRILGKHTDGTQREFEDVFVAVGFDIPERPTRETVLKQMEEAVRAGAETKVKELKDIAARVFGIAEIEITQSIERAQMSAAAVALPLAQAASVLQEPRAILAEAAHKELGSPDPEPGEIAEIMQGAPALKNSRVCEMAGGLLAQVPAVADEDSFPLMGTQAEPWRLSLEEMLRNASNTGTFTIRAKNKDGVYVTYSIELMEDNAGKMQSNGRHAVFEVLVPAGEGVDGKIRIAVPKGAVASKALWTSMHHELLETVFGVSHLEAAVIAGGQLDELDVISKQGRREKLKELSGDWDVAAAKTKYTGKTYFDIATVVAAAKSRSQAVQERAKMLLLAADVAMTNPKLQDAVLRQSSAPLLVSMPDASASDTTTPITPDWLAEAMALRGAAYDRGVLDLRGLRNKTFTVYGKNNKRQYTLVFKFVPGKGFKVTMHDVGLNKRVGEVTFVVDPIRGTIVVEGAEIKKYVKVGDRQMEIQARGEGLYGIALAIIDGLAPPGSTFSSSVANADTLIRIAKLLPHGLRYRAAKDAAEKLEQAMKAFKGGDEITFSGEEKVDLIDELKEIARFEPLGTLPIDMNSLNKKENGVLLAALRGSLGYSQHSLRFINLHLWLNSVKPGPPGFLSTEQDRTRKLIEDFVLSSKRKLTNEEIQMLQTDFAVDLISATLLTNIDSDKLAGLLRIVHQLRNPKFIAVLEELRFSGDSRIASLATEAVAESGLGDRNIAPAAPPTANVGAIMPWLKSFAEGLMGRKFQVGGLYDLVIGPLLENTLGAGVFYIALTALGFVAAPVSAPIMAYAGLCVAFGLGHLPGMVRGPPSGIMQKLFGQRLSRFFPTALYGLLIFWPFLLISSTSIPTILAIAAGIYIGINLIDFLVFRDAHTKSAKRRLLAVAATFLVMASLFIADAISSRVNHFSYDVDRMRVESLVEAAPSEPLAVAEATKIPLENFISDLKKLAEAANKTGRETGSADETSKLVDRILAKTKLLDLASVTTQAKEGFENDLLTFLANEDVVQVTSILLMEKAYALKKKAFRILLAMAYGDDYDVKKGKFIAALKKIKQTKRAHLPAGKDSIRNYFSNLNVEDMMLLDFISSCFSQLGESDPALLSEDEIAQLAVYRNFQKIFGSAAQFEQEIEALYKAKAERVHEIPSELESTIREIRRLPPDVRQHIKESAQRYSIPEEFLVYSIIMGNVFERNYSVDMGVKILATRMGFSKEAIEKIRDYVPRSMRVKSLGSRWSSFLGAMAGGKTTMGMTRMRPAWVKRADAWRHLGIDANKLSDQEISWLLLDPKYGMEATAAMWRNAIDWVAESRQLARAGKKFQRRGSFHKESVKEARTFAQDSTTSQFLPDPSGLTDDALILMAAFHPNSEWFVGHGAGVFDGTISSTKQSMQFDLNPLALLRAVMLSGVLDNKPIEIENVPAQAAGALTAAQIPVTPAGAPAVQNANVGAIMPWLKGLAEGLTGRKFQHRGTWDTDVAPLIENALALGVFHGTLHYLGVSLAGIAGGVSAPAILAALGVSLGVLGFTALLFGAGHLLGMRAPPWRRFWQRFNETAGFGFRIFLPYVLLVFDPTSIVINGAVFVMAYQTHRRINVAAFRNVMGVSSRYGRAWPQANVLATVICFLLLAAGRMMEPSTAAPMAVPLAVAAVPQAKKAVAAFPQAEPEVSILSLLNAHASAPDVIARGKLVGPLMDAIGKQPDKLQEVIMHIFQSQKDSSLRLQDGVLLSVIRSRVGPALFAIALEKMLAAKDAKNPKARELLLQYAAEIAKLPPEEFAQSLVDTYLESSSLDYVKIRLAAVAVLKDALVTNPDMTDAAVMGILQALNTDKANQARYLLFLIKDHADDKCVVKNVKKLLYGKYRQDAIRDFLLKYLEKMKTPESLDLLFRIAMWDEEKIEFRLSAAQAIKRLEAGNGAKPMTQRAMASIGLTIQKLLRGKDRRDPIARATWLKYLEEMGGRENCDILLGVAMDKEEGHDVRLSAAQAISRMADSDIAGAKTMTLLAMSKLFRAIPVEELDEKTIEGKKERELRDLAGAALMKGLAKDWPAETEEDVAAIKSQIENDFLGGKPIAISNAKVLRRLLIFLTLRSQEIRAKTLAPKYIAAIYSNVQFVAATQGLGPANQYSVARAVELTLKREGLALSPENIEKFTKFQLKVRARSASRVLIGKGEGAPPVIAIFHEEKRFDPEPLRKLCEELGIKITIIKAGKDHPNAKSEYLQAIRDSKSNVTIVRIGHGGPQHFWLANGTPDSAVTDMLHHPAAVSSLESSEALSDLAAKENTSDMSKATVIGDECFSGEEDVAENNALYEEGNVKKPAARVAAADRGSYGYGSQLLEIIMKALKDRGEVTFDDFFKGRETAEELAHLTFELPLTDAEHAELKELVSNAERIRRVAREKAISINPNAPLLDAKVPEDLLSVPGAPIRPIEAVPAGAQAAHKGAGRIDADVHLGRAQAKALWDGTPGLDAASKLGQRVVDKKTQALQRLEATGVHMHPDQVQVKIVSRVSLKGASAQFFDDVDASGRKIVCIMLAQDMVEAGAYLLDNLLLEIKKSHLVGLSHIEAMEWPLVQEDIERYFATEQWDLIERLAGPWDEDNVRQRYEWVRQKIGDAKFEEVIQKGRENAERAKKFIMEIILKRLEAETSAYVLPFLTTYLKSLGLEDMPDPSDSKRLITFFRSRPDLASEIVDFGRIHDAMKWQLAKNPEPAQRDLEILRDIRKEQLIQMRELFGPKAVRWALAKNPRAYAKNLRFFTPKSKTVPVVYKKDLIEQVVPTIQDPRISGPKKEEALYWIGLAIRGDPDAFKDFAKELGIKFDLAEKPVDSKRVTVYDNKIKEFPSLVSLLSNPDNGRPLLQLLSLLRLTFPYLESTADRAPPRSFARDSALSFEIAPGIFVSPQTGSFRRFRISTSHTQTKQSYDVEIKIPGQLIMKRTVDLETLDIASDMQRATAGETHSVEPIMGIDLPGGSYEMYGEKVLFSSAGAKAPKIAVFSAPDGPRLDHLSRSYLEALAMRYGIAYEQLLGKIAQDVLAGLNALASVGVATGLDNSIGNYRLIEEPDGIRAVLVGDFENQDALNGNYALLKEHRDHLVKELAQRFESAPGQLEKNLSNRLLAALEKPEQTPLNLLSHELSLAVSDEEIHAKFGENWGHVPENQGPENRGHVPNSTLNSVRVPDFPKTELGHVPEFRLLHTLELLFLRQGVNVQAAHEKAVAQAQRLAAVGLKGLPDTFDPQTLRVDKLADKAVKLFAVLLPETLENKAFRAGILNDLGRRIPVDGADFERARDASKPLVATGMLYELLNRLGDRVSVIKDSETGEIKIQIREHARAAGAEVSPQTGVPQAGVPAEAIIPAKTLENALNKVFITAQERIHLAEMAQSRINSQQIQRFGAGLVLARLSPEMDLAKELKNYMENPQAPAPASLDAQKYDQERERALAQEISKSVLGMPFEALSREKQQVLESPLFLSLFAKGYLALETGMMFRVEVESIRRHNPAQQQVFLALLQKLARAGLPISLEEYSQRQDMPDGMQDLLDRYSDNVVLVSLRDIEREIETGKLMPNKLGGALGQYARKQLKSKMSKSRKAFKELPKEEVGHFLQETLQKYFTSEDLIKFAVLLVHASGGELLELNEINKAILESLGIVGIDAVIKTVPEVQKDRNFVNSVEKGVRASELHA